jgi:hypothetical protein
MGIGRPRPVEIEVSSDVLELVADVTLLEPEDWERSVDSPGDPDLLRQAAQVHPDAHRHDRRAGGLLARSSHSERIAAHRGLARRPVSVRCVLHNLRVSVADGYRLTEGDGAETSGVMALVDALSPATRSADFESVCVRRFTETCPSAYDGQEIIYAFHRSGGDERMSTCEYVPERALQPFPQVPEILDAVER